MKRLIVISLILLSCISYAQNTLPVISFGDRKADLYYWDTNWYDQYERTNPGDTFYPGYLANYSFNSLPGDIYLGRACIANTPILVKGIAGAMAIRDYPPHGSITITADTTVLGRVPEQFILYDSNYNLLGEGTLYSSDTARYKMEFRDHYTRKYFKIYEVFFDKPVFVSGQFYVGGTTHNNLIYGYHEQYGWTPAWDHLRTLYPMYSQNFNTVTSYIKIPNPPVVLFKHNSPYNSSHPATPNGNFYTIYYDTVLYLKECDYFLPFFAIIDTNYIYIDCQQPIGMGIINADKDSVVVSWDSSDATQWDVMVWTDGMEPDSGMLFSVQTNQLTLYGLDIERNHYIKVKAVCDTFHINTSPWSDVFQLRVCDHIVCPVPEGLIVEPLASDGSVIMVWNHSDVDAYELAVCGDGDNEDSAALIQTQTGYLLLDGLDTARWYSAKVRSICDCGNASEWSDTVRFYVPNLNPGGEEPMAIEDVIARHTYLMPNPTSGKVMVLSSHSLQKVEVFDNSGKRIAEYDAGGKSMELDLSVYPAGTYIVRITTEQGMTTKLLVKK